MTLNDLNKPVRKLTLQDARDKAYSDNSKKDLMCKCKKIYYSDIDDLRKNNPGQSFESILKIKGFGTGCGNCLQDPDSLKQRGLNPLKYYNDYSLNSKFIQKLKFRT